MYVTQRHLVYAVYNFSFSQLNYNKWGCFLIRAFSLGLGYVLSFSHTTPPHFSSRSFHGAFSLGLGYVSFSHI